LNPKDIAKEILYNDREKVVYILEELGCYKINPRFRKDEIRCSLPDGTNATSVSIRIQPQIPCYVFSRGGFENYEVKDIITLVQFIRECNFTVALKWICGKLGVDAEGYVPTETLRIVSELRKEKRRQNKLDQEIVHNILSSDEIKKYVPCVVSEWIKEGLSPESQRKYGILNDPKSKRWLIPIYDEDGNLICFKGRTYAPNYEILGIPKYMYIPKLGTNDILFGMDKNKQNIKDKDEIILFESEKSTIAADSYRYDWSTNLGTNKINQLLKNKILATKVSNAVIALDKDVSWADNIEEAKKLSRYMNVDIVFDRQGLLTGKQSPVDAGKEVWEILYRTRTRVR
jgi:hypothetical protein